MPTRKTIKNFQLKDLLLPTIVVVVVLLLGTFRGQFVVANVNGHQISRLDLIRELEKKDGKTVLDSLITEQLILREGEKKKILVNDSEVNREIATIEKSIKGQGQNLDVLLSQQGMTRNDLLKQVKIQLLLKKIVGGVSVSDKEVNDYIDKNKDSIPQGSDESKIHEQVKQQLEQQKVNEKIQKLISDLQSKAKIEYFLKF